MKITQIDLENFKNFSKISINVNRDVTYIVGPNGSGKSTVGVDAIWFILRGVAERGNVLKGERRLFIKDGGEATGSLVLSDGINSWTVTRTISDKKQTLKIVSDQGEELGQDFIDSFWTDALINPMAFAEMSPKEQAQALGIDTSEFDEELKELKEERTYIGREIKAFGEVEIPEEVEPVNVDVLLQEKEEIIKFNASQEQLRRNRNEKLGRLDSLEAQIKKLEDELHQLRQNRRLLEDEFRSLPETQEEKSYTHIDEAIRLAAETNAKVQARNEAIKKAEAKLEKEKELALNLAQQEEVGDKKVAYIQSQRLPFGNLAVDDNGGLLLKGRPLKKPHFSTGELLRAIPMLMASKSPEFKYVFIQDWMLMDDEKQAETLNYLVSNGFQVVVEVVGKEKVTENAILLTEYN